jgi:energy-converting hydrogenase Eha subunit A
MLNMKKTASTIVLIFILLSMSTFLVSPTNAAEESWVTLEPMPTARSGLGVAVVDGKIYAIGGSNGTWVGTNEMFDPVTDTWTTKASMPTPRGAFGIAVYQDKIYVIGGTTSLNITGVNEVYDTSTDTWETRTSMPTSRTQLVANEVDGKIYVMAGYTFPHPSFPTLCNKTEVYNPVTDSWTTKASMPNYQDIAMADDVSAVVDNKIYVFGCSQRESNTLFTQIYDPETDTWSSGAIIPTEIYHASGAATTGEFAPKRIHVMGGTEHQIYDPETDSWSNGTSMPTPRRSLGLAVINDTLFAIGGSFGDPLGSPPSSSEPINTNEQYTPLGYIPEFPSLTSMLLILAVLAVAVAIYKRRLPKNQSTDK